MSNKTIYPVEDRSCAINSPTDTTCSVLNTIGGDKWSTAGQWVEYRFKVSSSGMYDIVSRFRQDVLDGMSTCRSRTCTVRVLPRVPRATTTALPSRRL